MPLAGHAVTRFNVRATISLAQTTVVVIHALVWMIRFVRRSSLRSCIGEPFKISSEQIASRTDE